MTQFHRLLRDFLIYGAGGVGLQLLTFFALPAFTRIFDPNEYGIIESITTLVLVAALVASLGLESASQRSYFDYGEEQEAERSRVLSTAFWVLLGSSVALAAALASLAGVLATHLLTSPSTLALAIAAIGLPVTTLGNFCKEILRVTHRPIAYTAVSLVAGLVSIALALVLSAIWHRHVAGYFLGIALGGVAGLGLGLAFTHSSLAKNVDRRELRIMLAYGLPLLPVAASSWVLQFVDRFFLLHYTSLRELGLYSVAVRLGNVLLLAVTAFAIAWSPLVLDLHRRDPGYERQFRARVLTHVTLFLSLGALTVAVYAREFLTTVTSSSYEEAYKAVGLLAGSVVALGINGVTMTAISLTRRTRFFARYAVYVTALNVTLNFLLIPAWGIVGAALATLTSYSALAGLYYVRAQALDPAPFEGRRLLLILATAAGFGAVGTFVNLDPVWLSALAKLPLLIGFLPVLWLLGAFDLRSLRLVPSLIREMANREMTA